MKPISLYHALCGLIALCVIAMIASGYFMITAERSEVGELFGMLMGFFCFTIICLAVPLAFEKTFHDEKRRRG